MAGNIYSTTGGKPVQGAWYEGRRYMDGVLLPAGQYEPGKTVSKEVAAQTNPANVSYLESKGVNFGQNNTPSTPTSKEGVTPFLNDFQKNIFESSQPKPEVRVPTAEELKTELAPKTEQPALLNRVAEFEKLRTEQGVSVLEQTLTDLKSQEEALVAQKRTRIQGEEGKPVALNVISGRVSEVDRQENEKIDTIQRQKSRVVDELNTKYSVINTYMNYKGLDYNDAVTAYDKEFSQNLQMYNIISGKEKDARSAFESDRDAARANLQIYTNLISKGNVDLSSMPADQQLQMSKLEIQSGLPVGFMASVKKDKNADIIFSNTNEGVTQVGIRNSDGTINVQSYGTSTAKGKAPTYAATDEVTVAREALDAVDTNGDKMVSLKEYEAARKTVYSQIADPVKAANALNTASNEYKKWKW